MLGRCRSFVPDLGAARDVLADSLPFAVVGLSVIVSVFGVIVKFAVL